MKGQLNEQTIKIFLTILLFIIGGLYINYSVNNGLIKANIKMSEVMADGPDIVCTGKSC